MDIPIEVDERVTSNSGSAGGLVYEGIEERSLESDQDSEENKST